MPLVDPAPPSPPIPVLLYTRPGCPLCEEAEAEILDLASGAPLRLEKKDISGDRGLEARWGESIPVVFVGGRLASKGRFDASRVARLLKEASLPPRPAGPPPGRG